MVLIYFKSKKTGKVLNFVKETFLTVEQAKKFLNTNNVTEMNSIVTCIDEVDDDSLIAFIYRLYLISEYEKEKALTDLQKTINEKIGNYLGKPKREG